jgi:uncharacterized cupin superfamily protein
VQRFNLFSDDWDMEHEHPGFRSRETSVREQIGATRIGASFLELGPGEKTWPYHFHHTNEEWLVVVRGTPTLRTPDGERVLREGDTVCFPRGPDGAHQVANKSQEAVRVLMLSTMLEPEVAEYPDSDKVGAWGEKFGFMLRREPQVDYWDGE